MGRSKNVLNGNRRRSAKKTEKESASMSKKRRLSAEAAVNNSLFGRLVRGAGIFLKAGTFQDEIGVDVSIFQKKLIAALKAQTNTSEVVEEFIEGLQEHTESPERFRLSLLPIVVAEESEGSIHGNNQESMMRIFLGIDILQPSVANMLLEKLPEFTDDDDRGTTEVNTSNLILNQFRWLDRIYKSKDLTQKMLDMVTITSCDVQHEIITCLPEVVDDAEHIEVARQLRELLLQNTDLTVPILDALTNLNLRPELLAEVRASVLQMLPSVELDDLPVVTKFILQSVSDTDAFEVMSELRENFDFTSSLMPDSASTPANQSRSKGTSSGGNKNGELLTLDAICSGIRFQKSVAEGWIKAIESVTSSAKHKVIDLFVLLILHSTGNRKKAVESLFRNKIKTGHFTEEMLSAAFCSHSQILREYFTDLLSLSEVLLRSPDHSVCSYACSIYRLAFLAFDLYCQQEIIGSLVTHIGSGYASEADASLDVLSVLVESHTPTMAPFAVFIKGILDYLDNLTMSQIRKVFSMLTTLAFHNPMEGAMIQDDVHIVIRKQLASNCPKYKRIGIIGTIMIVRGMSRIRCTEDDDTVDTQSQPQTSLTNDVYRQVINLLDMVRSSVSRDPMAAALFYDELSRIVAQDDVDAKVKHWISETVVSDFQDDFLVDREAPLPKDSLPIDFLYGLDEVEEGSIAVNILPLLLASNSKQAQTDTALSSLDCLAPHFRLLRTCEQSQHKGDLEGIDALLGCPLVSYKADMMEQMETLTQQDRDVICSALFYTVNWFREVVNAFSTQSDPEMRGKTLSRLNDITCLQKQIERALLATPFYAPRTATFDSEVSPPSPSAGQGAVTKRKKGRKTSKKIEKVVDITEIQDLEKENDKELDATAVSVSEKTKDKNSSAISISQYTPYLRELDMEVFSILKCGLVSRAVLDSNMNTEETTILQLQAPHLHFLLDDLHRKLNYSLSGSASSRRSFLKTRHDKQLGFSNLSRKSAKEVTQHVTDLLPALCEHLEATSAYFQTLLAANDGVLDGPGRNTEEASLMAQCFSLLFSLLQTYFSWSGFSSPANLGALKTAVGVLASRTKLSSTSQPDFREQIKQAFHYLEQFSGTVPDMATALSLTKLLVEVSERAEDKDINMAIAELTGGFLKREWIKSNGEKEGGQKYNEALQYLLRFHLSFSEDSMATVEEISAGALPELMEEESTGASTSYPTLNRSTMPSFYRAMLEELNSHLKLTQATPIKRADLEQAQERLIKLNIVVREFHILINIVKAFEQRSVLSSALKYGRIFVESFLKLGMPILDQMLRSHKDEVHGLLKNLQQSTRCLQHFCSHTKVTKDIALTNHVPAVKRTLELFVFRVKAMLTLNKCHEAFWLGNLKNRDIQGQEILSQQSQRAADDNPEGEEEGMDMDEEDLDEVESASVLSHETGANEEEEPSYSESF
ncbi:Fanconi anemia group D2 protein isoform X2 [Nematostella vectensis]|uniref:Fanconi anemia group D2 protein isoform X2 n=1 Tax=Nematostella vectensis TaxID=45351 RepID=UPI001390095B|nr:Fanconi anemia group D2 protein isoform X2 [Nematostella vectensis]